MDDSSWKVMPVRRDVLSSQAHAEGGENNPSFSIKLIIILGTFKDPLGRLQQCARGVHVESTTIARRGRASEAHEPYSTRFETALKS